MKFYLKSSVTHTRANSLEIAGASQTPRTWVRDAHAELEDDQEYW